MLALTIVQDVLIVVAIFVGLIVIGLLLSTFEKSKERFGRLWTYVGILVIAAGIASAVEFPLHHGDGRSNSYNDGWDFVATSTAGTFQNVYGSLSCKGIYQGEASANGRSFTHGETVSEWVHGCRDAKAALLLVEQDATIPVK